MVGVRLNDKWDFIDQTGKEITGWKYDFVREFHEGFAIVRLNGKWGFIDTTGKEVVECKYDEVLSFKEGFAIVRLNDKWGFIDTTGKEVIKCKYDEVYSFEEGLASVELNGIWNLIDQTGKIAFKFDDVNIIKISLNHFTFSNLEELKATLKKVKKDDTIEKYYDLIIDGNRVSFSTLEEREQFEKELFIEEEDFEKQYVLSKK